MAAANGNESGGLATEDYRDQSDFRYALRQFMRFSELQARKEGITPQQHLLLLSIRGHPEYPRVSIGEIAERMQMRPHSASLLVERSVQRGLIHRRPDTVDRRRQLVSLSTSGERILEDITRANRTVLGDLEDSMFRSSFVEALRRPAQADEEK